MEKKEVVGGGGYRCWLKEGRGGGYRCWLKEVEVVVIDFG